jgi:hypothetical protein
MTIHNLGAPNELFAATAVKKWCKSRGGDLMLSMKEGVPGAG